MPNWKPSFQVYQNDWLSDPEINSCEWASRGVWFALICVMNRASEVTGIVSGSYKQIANMIGGQTNEIKAAIDDLRKNKVADVTEHNGTVTVMSRRINREYKKRKNNALRQRTYRQSQKSHNNVPCARAEDEEEVEEEIEEEKEVDTKVKSKSEGSKVKVSNHARRFDEFWKEYPKKRAKQKCLQKWESGRFDDMADQIIDDVTKRKLNDERWRRDNGRYIPDPLTYLNGERWEDEMEKKPAQHNPLDAFPTFNG